MISAGACTERTASPPESTFWEAVAASVWGTYISEIERQVILRAQALVSPPTRALEIGCEGGRWSKMLSDLGWEMTCIDVNPQTLNACQLKVPAARCILTSPRDEALPVSPASVALLLCIEVGPVIQSDWFLPEAQRVLELGGVLVGVFWNRTSWRGLQARLKYRFKPLPTADFYRHPYLRWRKNLANTGFALVFEKGFCWGPFKRASNSPLIPSFVRLERLFRLDRLPAVSPWVAFVATKSRALPGPVR